MFRKICFLILGLIPLALSGQKPLLTENESFYTRQNGAGLLLATNGIGLDVFYGFQKRKQNVWILSFALGNLKSEKQTKTYNNNYKDARGYFYGKINNLLYANLSFGGAHLLYESKRYQGIEISGVWSAGIDLVYLKPVYLLIREPYTGGQGFEDPENVRYNPEIHYQENIYGKSTFFTGINNGKFTSGLQLKAGVLFNLSKFDQSIRGIEIGAKVDYLFQPVELMFASPSKSFFNALYAKFVIGAKRS